MENPHFSWKNPLFLWPCSITMFDITRLGNSVVPPCLTQKSQGSGRMESVATPRAPRSTWRELVAAASPPRPGGHRTSPRWQEPPRGRCLQMAAEPGTSSKHSSNWWLSHPPEKYESQIGSSSQLVGKIKNVPNHHLCPSLCATLP